MRSRMTDLIIRRILQGVLAISIARFSGIQGEIRRPVDGMILTEGSDGKLTSIINSSSDIDDCLE